MENLSTAAYPALLQNRCYVQCGYFLYLNILNLLHWEIYSFLAVAKRGKGKAFLQV